MQVCGHAGSGHAGNGYAGLIFVYLLRPKSESVPIPKRDVPDRNRGRFRFGTSHSGMGRYRDKRDSRKRKYPTTENHSFREKVIWFVIYMILIMFYLLVQCY